MFIFEENYYQYDIVHLKSAIRLLEAGSQDGAFEMYLRSLICNYVIRPIRMQKISYVNIFGMIATSMRAGVRLLRIYGTEFQ